MAVVNLSEGPASGRVSIGYRRLDDALQGGFPVGAAVVLRASTSDELPLLLRKFLTASQMEHGLLICGRLSTAESIAPISSHMLKFIVCESAPPSENVVSGVSPANLTELNIRISEVLRSDGVSRVVLEILSDVLLRNKVLQTRKWLGELLTRLRSRKVSTIVVINPNMHPREEVEAVAALFDGSLEIVESAVGGESRRMLHIGWMHGTGVIKREVPLRDLLLESLTPDQRKALAHWPKGLPAPPTQLIGREKELTAAQQILRGDVRLLTLTGAGGTGKTRLSLEIAASMVDDFSSGVSFVPLAPVHDPDFVISAIAGALRVKEEKGCSLLESVKSYLQEKRAMLVLDNFEHVITAAPLVADLLAGCPQLKVLVTSREPLHLRSEHEFQVPPLTLPDIKRLSSDEEMSRYEAVAFFYDRAKAVNPSFSLTKENQRAVAEICIYLDGLPLALELAASRIKLLSPEAMRCVFMDSSFLSLLEGGARDMPARQQTMRRAVAWSHDLLDPEEKILFRRLSVFVGGFTLEGVGAVCDAAKDLRKSIVELLSSLVDKSLLRQHDGGVRFGMLQVIREFALERLEENEESEAIRRNHVSFFLRMVEEAAPELTGPNQSAWLDKIELEHDNLRAILHQLVQDGESALSIRFVAALWRFWHIRGYLSEGRDWLVKALADKTLTDPIRPKVINGAGMIAREQGDYVAATSFFKEGLALAQQLGDMPAAATSLNSLGLLASDQGDYSKALGFFSEALEIRRKQDDKRGTGNTLNNIALAAQEQGEYDKANKFFEESLAIGRELGDQLGIAQSLNNLGIVAQLRGDYERAHVFYEESLHLCRELGNKVGVAQALNNLGIGARQQGDYKNAQALLEESLAISREVGSKISIASTLECLGLLAFKQNDCKKATILYSESLTIFKELEATSGICCCLEDLAGVASALGGSENSARLFGAAEALRENIHKPLAPIEREDYNHNVATARNGLDEETFATAWAQGRSMTLSEAIAHALAYAGSAS